ncbi:methylated-DNA-[protein]-cysteine S-methyltransferase [Rhizobium aquaticum]|uniref:Methylated-DNA-[protein]-cysteine S-methyltransferase n=1 Tax=Rhizobium aquaticum TaxID=1549636 RepID=A0ABV2J1N2_9HYPH
MDSAEYMLFETALGVCGIAWSEAGLLRVQLPDRDAAATAARLAKAARRAGGAVPAFATETAERLSDYAAGEAVDFSDIILDFDGVAAFEATVYHALRRVGRGETVTYGELAMLAGSPGAAQAVGTAMARNPWPVVVPCHRVLAAGNKPGGFSAPGGLVTKAKLLAMEGVHLDGGEPMLPGLFD